MRILTFEGEAHVQWINVDLEDYEEAKIGSLWPSTVEPKRI